MTVAELIASLQAMPQDATVVCGGFDEYGIDETQPPVLIRIDRDVRGAGHQGPHDAGAAEVAVWLDWSDPPATP